MKGNIKTFDFTRVGFDDIRRYHFGMNWPVVYLIENKKEIYVGETTSVYSRSRQHYEVPHRRKLNRIHLISDEEFNKSATLDIESLLIQYMLADGTFKLQNGTSGLVDHNYFDKEKYRAKFEILWDELKRMSLAKNDLSDIRNSNIFKYSPYKALTEDQINIADQIIKRIEIGSERTYVVNGGPGTGKTILGIYLFKRLMEIGFKNDLKIGLVVPMTSLRNTLRKVFKQIPGLKANMVMGPSDVVGGNFDLLIVDEAHRLKQRRNITNYESFDSINRKFGLENDGNELDWIVRSSRHQVLLYDKNQSVKPSDIDSTELITLNAVPFHLKSQKRVLGGEEYIQMVEDLFSLRSPKPHNFQNYDFKIYDNINQMVEDIKQKDRNLKLCRVVAGYAWTWKTKTNNNSFDIEIDGLKLTWNSTNSDWVNSPNAINEVGCIHTVQGYDLNYAGVIIGPELSYDTINNKFVIDKEKYMDINGKRSITDPNELERYIINIYKTLLTRGIKGTYVFIVDKALREYFMKATM